jgi:hypothetical protein
VWDGENGAAARRCAAGRNSNADTTDKVKVLTGWAMTPDDGRQFVSRREPDGVVAEGMPTGIVGEGGELDGGREADRRRYCIIRRLIESPEGRITIGALQADRRFRRAFKHRGNTTLEEDLRELAKLLGAGRSVRVVREGVSTLCWLRAGESSFARKGYCAVDVASEKLRLETEEKRRIGEFIAGRLLDAAMEVLYLSTGTTVYQVALALLNGKRDNVSVVVTDNMAVVELFCQRALSDERLKQLQLHVLGGRVLFDHADIARESEVEHFGRWKCSKAVISVTGINADTGQLYSIREPERKEMLLRDTDIRQVIIPVLPNKMQQGGGRLIHDPREEAQGGHDWKQEGRVYKIVTTRLDAGVRTRLERHGYEVWAVDEVEHT